MLNAADIRRNDALATARLQRSQLVVAQTASQIRLQQRISARRPAAQMGVAHRRQIEAGGRQ